MKRTSRFSARVRVDGKEQAAYVPNSGRMEELLQPGRRVYLSEQLAPHRKTTFDLLMVSHGEISPRDADGEGLIVSIDSRVPNQMMKRILEEGSYQRDYGHLWGSFDYVKPEYTYGASRIDFLLSHTGKEHGHLIEVKSVTLVQEGVARFPDAPTERGARHLDELAAAAGQGYRASVVFFVQRNDAVSFEPNDAMDPDFGDALRRATGRGVVAHAFRCNVTPARIEVAGLLPVSL